MGMSVHMHTHTHAQIDQYTYDLTSKHTFTVQTYSMQTHTDTHTLPVVVTESCGYYCGAARLMV